MTCLSSNAIIEKKNVESFVKNSIDWTDGKFRNTRAWSVRGWRSKILFDGY